MIVDAAEYSGRASNPQALADLKPPALGALVQSVGDRQEPVLSYPRWGAFEGHLRGPML